MAAYSALDFASRALRLIGVIDPTQTPDPEDAQTCFDALNDMLDNWATQRWTIFVITRNIFPLTAGVATYSLGIGGSWGIVRPVWIDRVSVIPDIGAAQPLEIPIGRPLSIADFQAIAIKSATSTFPDRVYWDRGFTGGLSNVTVYPVPTSSTAAIVLYVPTALTAFPNLSTQFTFPPGYARALRFNLAMEIAPEYGAKPPDELKQNAAMALADIKRANFNPVEAQFDVGLVGRARYNIYSDSY